MPGVNASAVKVRFALAKDEDGYPPFSSENMWCIPLEGGGYRVVNIPFFVTGVSYNDVIAVSRDAEGRLNFERVLEEGGHSTLRVLLSETSSDGRSEAARANDLGERMRKLGCTFQISPPPEILAIDVPPSALLQPVRAILQKGEEDQLWTFEEATLAHSE